MKNERIKSRATARQERRFDFPNPARANVATQTASTPRSFNAPEISFAVAPEVNASSTSRIRFPFKRSSGTAFASTTAKAPATFSRLASQSTDVCGGVARTRRTVFVQQGTPSSRANADAKKSGELTLRKNRRRQFIGTGTTASGRNAVNVRRRASK